MGLGVLGGVKISGALGALKVLWALGFGRVWVGWRCSSNPGYYMGRKNQNGINMLISLTKSPVLDLQASI